MANYPERLGKYRVTGVLGQGAMGIVYKGHDPDIRRDVALKTMRSSLGGEAEPGVSPADRFRNEARAAGRLHHPGIVGVYDYGHDAGVDFIAMEYVRGHTLSRYLVQVSAGQLAIADDDVLSIAGQLLEALHHAHEQGVWHRDIKPSNLILTPEGKLKISDFGIARIESAELTQVASLIGTPMYMAPEQFKGHVIDRRVDLYAAGVVLYQLLVGRPPFTGAPEALMYKAVHDPHLPPSQAPGLAHLAPYDAIIDRALAKLPTQRFDHALQFRDALALAVGRMHKATVSEATMTVLLPRTPAADQAAGSAPVPHFDAASLALAEASLARHVGPLAQVLVKRAARECHDLPALYARLAEQVTDPAARHAFVQQIAHQRTGTGSGAARPAGAADAPASPHEITPRPVATQTSGPVDVSRSGRAPAAQSGASAAAQVAATSGSGRATPLSPALLSAAQHLLALQLGPIAKLLVRRAAEAQPQREGFIRRLAASLDDPVARQRLLQALNRLP